MILLLLAAAHAAAPEHIADEPFQLDAADRLVATLPPDPVLDDAGNTVGQDWALDHRLRVAGRWERRRGTWSTEWDLATGQVAGDPWDIPVEVGERPDTGLSPFRWATPRKLKWSGRFGPGLLSAGLDTSHWGLGILSNDGDHRPVFGRVDGGDRVARLAWLTRPFASRSGPLPLHLAVLADLVVEDENARLLDGQRALQLTGTAFYQDEEGRMAGLYLVGRDQIEADGERRTRVGVADVALDLFPAGARTVRPRVALEAAGILGTTSRATTYGATDALLVAAGGAAGEAGLGFLDDVLGLFVRGGVASGDANPDDDLSTDFTFDPNFEVGPVLFDQLAAAVEASTYAEIADPANAGQPPDGAELLVTGGAVRRTAYVQPTIDLQPLSWIRADAGVLLAWATAPWSDPFLSLRAGGVPLNHLGEPIEDAWLGMELDWSLSFSPAFPVGRRELSPALRVQGGHLVAGAALGGDLLHLFQAQLTTAF